MVIQFGLERGRRSDYGQIAKVATKGHRKRRKKSKIRLKFGIQTYFDAYWLTKLQKLLNLAFTFEKVVFFMVF